ncbi:hypothetical protein KQX54_004642 [Cotesia glomerata]|uniref:Uncharacterized protein n=1 Tax=Cotesia glomerata TaxID=32391 RepID=A0AAV7J4A1_COTGL|nr:hypothetical protein KQX54_004642 [Cotesia glomerata]
MRGIYTSNLWYECDHHTRGWLTVLVRIRITLKARMLVPPPRVPGASFVQTHPRYIWCMEECQANERDLVSSSSWRTPREDPEQHHRSTILCIMVMLWSSSGRVTAVERDKLLPSPKGLDK